MQKLSMATNKKEQKKQPQKKRPSFFQQLFITVLIIMGVGLLYSMLSGNVKEKESKEYSLSQVATMIGEQKITDITVRGDKLELIFSDKTEGTSKKEREASLTESLTNYGVDTKELGTVKIDIKNESGFGYWVGQLLPIILPLIIVIIIVWFFMGQMRGSGMKAFSFGNSRARILEPHEQKVTFKDIAGNIEAKQELIEVVDFLRNPKKYLEIGAKIPKGVLLTGSPGTGKTLLARAVAGEAGVLFFHISGSEFVEMFVGVGASRVRDLFDQAKKASPAIIFIDEIDAIGRQRGNGSGGNGHDEREQTLNQILVEMDGFEPTNKLVVMAATNRPDVLDEALLRPGRFDRRVYLDLPDRKDRLAILKIHARNKKIVEGINLEVVAERTPGFSGADLESLMNESAILAARRNKKEIEQTEILESIEKVMIGPERKSHLHTDQDRKITAYHEAGHALVASVLPNADPVHKVSIIARGNAGGYTMKLPLEERKLSTKKEYIDDIAMSLGGYATEQIIFDDVTTGPSNDLQVATKLARNMVTRWGMSDAIGPIALESSEGRALFGQGVTQMGHSDRHEELIDNEVEKLMKAGLATAREVITKHRDVLEAITQALLEREVLEQDEYNEIIKKFGIIPKEKTKTEGVIIEENFATA
jgi:cell division protease FtsH